MIYPYYGLLRVITSLANAFLAPPSSILEVEIAISTLSMLSRHHAIFHVSTSYVNTYMNTYVNVLQWFNSPVMVHDPSILLTIQ